MSGLQRQWRWVVMVATGMGFMIADGFFQATGPYLPAWKEHFNCSMAEVSVIASVNVFCYHIGGLSGTVVNIVGYRSVVMFSGLMTGLGILLSSLVSSRVLMVMTYGVIAGTFTGSNYQGSVVAIASYFKTNFSTIWGFCSAGTALGLIIMPPLVQYMIDQYGWRGSMLLSSGILFHVVVCGTLLRPIGNMRRPLRPKSFKNIPEAEEFVQAGKTGFSDPNPSSKLYTSEGDETSNLSKNIHTSNINDTQFDFVKPEKINEEQIELERDNCFKVEKTQKKTSGQEYLLSDHSDVAKVLNSKINSKSTFTRICYMTGLPILLHSFRMMLPVTSNIIMGVCINFVLSHLHSSIVFSGVNSQTASLFVSLIGIGSVFGRAGHGVLIDYGFISTKNLCMISMVMCGLCIVLYRVTRVYWIYVVLSVGIGASSGTFFSVMVVLCRFYVGKEHMGRAVGLTLLAHGIGGCIGPVIGGLAYDTTGSYDYPFFIYGGIVMASSLIFLLEPALNRMESSRAARKLQDIRRKEYPTNV